MRRFRGCLVVAFIFFCGFAVGGFLGAAFGWVQFFQQVTKGGPGAVRKIVGERIVHDLRLTKEQQAEARKIIDETEAELDAATADVRPKIQEILARNSARIRPLLDEKQKVKFDRFTAAAERRWNAAASKRPPPAATPAP